MFGNISNTLSIYLVAKRVHFGDFIQSIDALFILVWIMCIFNYLAVVMHFMLISFKKIVNIKHEDSMIYSFSAILFALSMLPKNHISLTFFESSVYKYSSLIFVFVISFSILILGYIKKKHEISKGENTIEKIH